eukprot:g9009.t1
MPSNSSFSAKKRSVTATRKKTKKRMLQKQKGLSGQSEYGLKAHDYSQGMYKRKKLYAHQKKQKGPSDFGGARVPDTIAEKVVHECSTFMTTEDRLQALLKKLEEVRAVSSGKRQRAKTVIFVKNKKSGLILAPKLGWGGKSAEVLLTKRTAKHGTGSLARIKSVKGVGLLSAADDDDDARELAIDKYKAGAIHTMIIAAPTEEDRLVQLLLPQANTIAACFALNAPSSETNYIERCALVSLSNAISNPGMHTLMLKTKRNIEVGGAIFQKFNVKIDECS